MLLVLMPLRTTIRLWSIFTSLCCQRKITVDTVVSYRIGGCVHSGGEDNWGDVSLPSTQEDIKLCSKVY